MLKFKFLFLALGVLSLTSIDLGSTQAASYYRQYYESSWSYNPDAKYFYRHYYYYPSVQSPTYSYQYTILYPSQPRYVYFYNPVEHYFWGRYDLKEKALSLLKEEDRKINLDDIKEAAFQKPSKMPAIPGSTDGVEMDAPPSDLPKDFK